MFVSSVCPPTLPFVSALCCNCLWVHHRPPCELTSGRVALPSSLRPRCLAQAPRRSTVPLSRSYCETERERHLGRSEMTGSVRYLNLVLGDVDLSWECCLRRGFVSGGGVQDGPVQRGSGEWVAGYEPLLHDNSPARSNLNWITKCPSLWEDEVPSRPHSF